MATNLSYLYLLEKQIGLADKYCDMALSLDWFNAKAKVNKGNVYFYKDNFL